jgi:hypothetical protein
VRLGVDRFAVAGWVVGNGEDQAKAGEPGGIVVVHGRGQERFAGDELHPDLFPRLPDDRADGVFADLEFAGGSLGSLALSV